MFRIYKNDKLVVEGESPLTITGIEPNTQVVEGTYQAVRVENEKESERVDIPAFKTLPIDVTGVTIAPKTVELEVGETQQLASTVAPANATNKAVTYASKAKEIADVSAGGLITAKVAGETEIVVTTSDGDKKDTCTVTVKEPVIAVTGVTIAPKTNNLEVGATRQLNATVEPTNATNKTVTYESDDEAVATVNASGLVTAVSKGGATITVKTADGSHTDTATVNVTVPEPEEPEE